MGQYKAESALPPRLCGQTGVNCHNSYSESKFARRLPMGPDQIRNYRISFMGQHERSVKMTDISVLVIQVECPLPFYRDLQCKKIRPGTRAYYVESMLQN